MYKILFKCVLLIAALVMGAGAVWADTYVKVSSDADLVNGETYIIACNNGVATSYSNYKLLISNSGYTTSGNSIITSTLTPLEFELGSVTSGYSLKMSDGYYLGYSGKNNTNFRNTETNATANNEKWTIAYNSTYNMYTIVNVQSTGRHIGSNGSDKLAPYASMSANAPATLYKKQAPFTLTAISNDESKGTVSVSGLKITANPIGHNRVSVNEPYTVTNGTATVSQNGNVFTVTASADCTVQINFEASLQHSSAFYSNGILVQSQDVYEYEDIVFPSNPSDIGEFKFLGWSNSTISGKQNDKPEMVTSATMGTSDINFYAVYAKGSTSSVEHSYTLDYDKETALSSSTNWGNYGISYSYTATDGGTWVVKANKYSGMQINTGQNASIKVPNCPGNITTIGITGTTAKAVGLSASDYSGSGTITYLAAGTDATVQTLDLSEQSVTTGYIVAKSGNIVIKKIVVNYIEVTDSYYDYCTSIITDRFEIGQHGYATYSPSAPVSFTGSAVTAYTVKVENGSAQLTAVTEVPAGAGVLLEGTEATYEVPVLASATALESNDLQVSDGTVTGAANIYCLANGNNGVGFYRVAYTVTIPEGKCYLQVPSVSRAYIGIEGDSSGITTVTRGYTTSYETYDLQGRRVAQPAKGLYIVNGKKINIR